MKEGKKDLELHEDIEQSRTGWKIKKISFIVMLLIVAAALLGLFGPGPISSSRAGEKMDDFYIEYERFLRSRANVPFRVHFIPSSSDTLYELWMDSRFFEKAVIEKIIPEPDSWELSDGKMTFSFKLNNTAKKQMVSFYIKPMAPGSRNLTIGNKNGKSYKLNLFTYP